MEVNLNFNSLDAKLYRWFYLANEMPKSLCPYFWKLLFMWVIIIPYSIFSLSCIILNSFKKLDFNNNIGIYAWHDRILISLLFNSLLFVLVAMCYSLFNLSNYELLKENIFFQIGLMFSAVLTVFFIVLLIVFIFRKIKKYKSNKFHNPNSNIIVNMVVATYKKYCPKINWFK